jgi:hypothetical protein
MHHLAIALRQFGHQVIIRVTFADGTITGATTSEGARREGAPSQAYEC